MDSILPHIRQHYEERGVPILYDPDQDSTDFTKSLNYLRSNASRIVPTPITEPVPEVENEHHPSLDVLILGGLGGRVDQAFSQIHHLYAMAQSNSTTNSWSMGNLYLISEESISFMLRQGPNTIDTPGVNRPNCARPANSTPYLPYSDTSNNDHDPYVGWETHYLEENIGIVPISGPAHITTHGFEWDVTNWRSEIGGQISTSNHIRADRVQVDSDQPVLFTMELAARFKVGGKSR
jgi:thiamine pyrophosphokinase